MGAEMCIRDSYRTSLGAVVNMEVVVGVTGKELNTVKIFLLNLKLDLLHFGDMSLHTRGAEKGLTRTCIRRHSSHELICLLFS